MMAAHQRLLDKQAEQREADLRAFRERTANRSQAAGDVVSTVPCSEAHCVALTLRLQVSPFPRFPGSWQQVRRLCTSCMVHLCCPQLRGALPTQHSEPPHLMLPVLHAAMCCTSPVLPRSRATSSAALGAQAVALLHDAVQPSIPQAGMHLNSLLAGQEGC